MADYKLFCFDGAGKVWVDDWIVAESDEEAVAAARAVKDAEKCELWHRSRLVARIDGGRTIWGEPTARDSSLTPARTGWKVDLTDQA